MKKYIFTTLVACLALSHLLLAQTRTEDRPLRNFSKIKVANSIEVELRKGDTPSASITANGIELDNIITEVSKETLEVKLGRGNFRSSTVKMTITYTELDEVAAATSASVVVKDLLDARQIVLASTTSGYIEAEVATETLFLDATSSGKIFVEGSTDRLNLKVFTSADIDAENLKTNRAEVQGNTAGKAIFEVANEITGSAATGARIRYIGNPSRIEVRTGTGGTVEKNE
ncbi:MAG: head GIN domain-containing protein [Nitritalea sp.]